MYGIIEFGGKKYIERYRDIPQQIDITVGLSLNQSINLIPSGTYAFLLKLLKLQVTTGAPTEVPAVRLFKYRLGNSDGGIYYIGNDVASTTGGIQQRVVSTLTFGNGQFPYPLVPPIFFDRNANMQIEIEDISNNVPYRLHFAYTGSFLIPFEG
ncbi:MAG: hypothetical protein L0Y56_08460 [Nitrospira sp.]|nr:hypothetical protein [Nitrospira sp.]